MRFRIARGATIFVIFLNVVVLYFTWKLMSNLNNGSVMPVTPPPNVRPPSKHISKSVTIVIRQFEQFDNDIRQTVESFLNLFPNIQILILSETFPYPPLELPTSNNSTQRNVKLRTMGFNIRSVAKDHNPMVNIKTKYVLIVPDSSRINSRQVLQSVLSDLNRLPRVLTAVPYTSAKMSDKNCLRVNYSAREWSVNYTDMSDGHVCDAVVGKHAILAETNLLKRLPEAFMQPFPEALYLQAAANNIKTRLYLNFAMNDGRQLYRSQHTANRMQSLTANRRKQMFNKMSIKKVIEPSGNILWFGCTRETKSCIGTIIDNMPYYLHLDKYTPPCCLNGLKKTALHVLEQLDDAGVRYWLDGSSLLGSVRHNDLIPWENHVTMGFYAEDLRNCHWLERARNRPITDNKGYVWQKATQGDFYKIQYSHINNLHVTLLPYKVKNGTMIKNNWTSKRKMDFSDSFLHPMSTILFLGRQAPSPNNVRDFLELRYEKGVIENVQYPNASKGLRLG